MLKVLYNEASDANIEGTINISGNFLSVSAKNGNYEGTDTVEAMASYNSYIFARCPNSKVKNFRTITRSDYKFLNMNRLGVAIKMDYTDMIQLFSEAGIMQIDTGIMAGSERDIIIRIFEGKYDSFTIKADMPFEVGTFNSNDLPTGSHPRTTLWDSYAIIIDGTEYHADRKGRILQGDTSIPIMPPKNQDYIDIEIQKRKGAFGNHLSRDIDCEDVILESTCGLLNARRIRLKNGHGHVRLYPLGYAGPFKLKLGRKWYEVWNEYNLIMA